MRRAGTYSADGRNGRKVQKCALCRKTAFATEADAVEGVRAALLSGWLLLRPYEGRCGWWHLTSQLDGRGRKDAA